MKMRKRKISRNDLIAQSKLRFESDLTNAELSDDNQAREARPVENTPRVLSTRVLEPVSAKEEESLVGK